MSNSIEMHIMKPPTVPVNKEVLFKKAENDITATPATTQVNSVDLGQHELPFQVAGGVTPVPSLDIQYLTCCSDLTRWKIFFIVFQVVTLLIFNFLCAFYGLASFNGFSVKMEVDEPTFYALMALAVLAAAVCGGSLTTFVIMCYFSFQRIKFTSKWKGIVLSIIYVILGAFITAASVEELIRLGLVLKDKDFKKFDGYRFWIFGFSSVIGFCAGIISGSSLDKDITSKVILLITLAAAPITFFFLHLGFTVIHPGDAIIIDFATMLVFGAILIIAYNRDDVMKGCRYLARKISAHCIVPAQPDNPAYNIENV